MNLIGSLIGSGGLQCEGREVVDHQRTHFEGVGLDEFGAEAEVLVQGEEGDALQTHHDDLDGAHQRVRVLVEDLAEGREGQLQHHRVFGGARRHRLELARLARQVICEAQQRTDRLARLDFLQRDRRAVRLRRRSTIANVFLSLHR